MTSAQSNLASGERSTFFQTLAEKRRELAIVVGLTLGPVALAACSDSSANAKGPDTSISASPTSSPSVSPEATKPAADRYKGADFELKKSLPSDLEYINSPSFTPEMFMKLPKMTQLKWSSWAEQYKQEFIAMFSAVSGDTPDAPYTLTPDSDVMTLIKEEQYIHRIADNMGSGTPTSMDDNGQLNKDMFEKILIAHSSVSNLTQANQLFDSANENDKGLAINVVQQAATHQYDLAEEAQKAPDFISKDAELKLDDGTDIKAYEFSYTQSDGRASHNIIGAVTYTDFEGKPAITIIYQ